ncbi:MAG: hypothetical protein U0350_06425 [Caldilineaceae bacterium]
MIPIQVTEEGVLIPKTYLRNANEVEVVVTGDYFLIKPKQKIAAQPPPKPAVQEAPPPPRQPVNQPPRRNPLIAGVRPRNPQAAPKAEPLLDNEADRRNFTLQGDKPGSEFDIDL